MGYGFHDRLNYTVLDWPLEAQCAFADGLRFELVSAILFCGADFLCHVTDIWSRRYSKHLLVHTCYNWQDLILPSSFSACFPERRRFCCSFGTR